jgi:hypothetical protein
VGWGGVLGPTVLSIVPPLLAGGTGTPTPPPPPLLSTTPLPDRLRSTGSTFDSLEVFVSGSGYGTRATRAIAVGEPFVNITRAATMDEAAAVATSPVGPVITRLYAEHGTQRQT